MFTYIMQDEAIPYRAKSRLIGAFSNFFRFFIEIIRKKINFSKKSSYSDHFPDLKFDVISRTWYNYLEEGARHSSITYYLCIVSIIVGKISLRFIT